MQQLGYLTFKRAALVALYVQAGLGGEDAMQARVQKQNLQQVTSALLDEEWEEEGVVSGSQAAVLDMRQGKQGTKRVREEQEQKLQERELEQQEAEATQQQEGLAQQTAVAAQQQEEAAPTSNYALRARLTGAKQQGVGGEEGSEEEESEEGSEEESEERSD